MKTIYNSYSTQFKMEAIINKSIKCNKSTKHYWKTNGFQKLLQAKSQYGNTLITDLLKSNNSDFAKLLNELFALFMPFTELTKKSKTIFKKSRASIVSIWNLMKPFATIEYICKWFEISERTYFNWNKRTICKLTPNKECPNVYPNQLRDWERRCLENDYFFNPKYSNYSISELLGQVMADKKVIVCESLFYEYARFLGEAERRKPKRFIKKYIPLKAKNPFEILQMDRTKIPIKNTKGVWLNLIIDNYSRAILSFLITTKSHSKHTLKNLQTSIKTHNLINTPFKLVTDDGSENKGYVKQFIKLMPNITHLIAQKDITQSNSMIEAVNKQLKYRYFSKKEYQSIEEFIIDCNNAITTYNNRPRKIHIGQSPLQVLNGNEFTLFEYTLLKDKTRKERIIENQNFNCLKAFY